MRHYIIALLCCIPVQVSAALAIIEAPAPEPSVAPMPVIEEQPAPDGSAREPARASYQQTPATDVKHGVAATYPKSSYTVLPAGFEYTSFPGQRIVTAPVRLAQQFAENRQQARQRRREVQGVPVVKWLRPRNWGRA